MEIPNLASRIYTAFYGIWLKPEMKMKLKELKTFHGKDSSEFVRIAIQEKLDAFESERIITGQKIVAVLELPRGNDL